MILITLIIFKYDLLKNCFALNKNGECVRDFLNVGKEVEQILQLSIEEGGLGV